MEVHRLREEHGDGVRQALSRNARSPRILCWKCKRLTPFSDDVCEFCGARFAGSTGGAYGGSKKGVPPVPAPDRELAASRRTLHQLIDDLQRVHDVSSSVHHEPVRGEETITLFQCPSCGRFVAQEATECACGVRFASSSDDSLCPECGAHISGGHSRCPVCHARPGDAASEIAYACPLCGAEVSADAVRCACGARFEA